MVTSGSNEGLTSTIASYIVHKSTSLCTTYTVCSKFGVALFGSGVIGKNYIQKIVYTVGCYSLFIQVRNPSSSWWSP